MSVNLTATVGVDAATNVIGFNCSFGRQAKTDTYSSTSATLTIRYQGLPASWVLGANVIVEIDGYEVCNGYITNVQYNYDFVTAGDTYTVSLEGYLSYFGRSVLTNFTFTQQTTGDAANTIAGAISGTAKSITQIQTRSYTDTSTYSGASQNLITALVAMEQGRLDDQGDVLKFLGRDFTYADFNDSPPIIQTYYFADDGTANYYKYDNITFSSLSNNYFTYIQIEPALFATQTAGSGNRALTLDTYDISATQADNLADYCLAEFDQSTSAPIEISTRSSLGLPAGFLALFENYRVGARTQIKFRGTEYYGVIEGYNISATPSEVRYTFYMSGFEQNNFFRLDDPVYGVLDFNNLNF